MHSYLRAVGFSKVKSRKEMQEIIRDVMSTYDEKIAVENHPDGVLWNIPRIMAATAELQSVGSMTRKMSFTWNIHFHFFAAQESRPRSM